MKKLWLIVRYSNPFQTILLVKSVTSQCQTSSVSGIVTTIVDALSFQIYCDHNTDGGAWTTILHRQDGTVDFASPLWTQYATQGAGSLGGEFFLPLEYLYLLTKYGPKELLVEMRKGTENAWAYFESFQVEDAANNYRLQISGYDPASTAGDGMSNSNGQEWSTADNDNDISGRNCALSLKSGWWFHACHDSNPLGVYGADGQSSALSWVPFKGTTTPLDSISFKIRTKRCQTNYGQACLKCLAPYYLCTNKFSGRLDCCSTPIDSCSEATATGVWDILQSGYKFRVWCDAEFEGGGWTAILRRQDGSVDFLPTQWKQYAQVGAGDITGEFIMSLRLMHLLTQDWVMELHVDLAKGSDYRFAKYGSFSVADLSDYFRLSISEYETLSTVGDSLEQSNGGQWSSPDNDLTGKCTARFMSSFWFTDCTDANPLGVYGSSQRYKATIWTSFLGDGVPLDYFYFLIRPNICQLGSSKGCTNCVNDLYICATQNQGTTCCQKPLSSCEQAQYTGSYHLLYKSTLMLVRCVVRAQGSPWTSILKRYNGVVDFNSPGWTDYAQSGVGNVGFQFFLALDYIHLLTEDGDMELLVQMQVGGETASARYGQFMIDAQKANYRLTVSSYDSTSSAGDSLTQHTGYGFSTNDRDNDGEPTSSCAADSKGPFWFHNCFDASPLGEYGDAGGQGVHWLSFKIATLDSISFLIRKNLCEVGVGDACTKCKSGYFLCTTEDGLLECCPKLITSCEAVTTSGIYQIGVQGGLTQLVYCRVTLQYGVLTQLLSRDDASVNDFQTASFDDYAYKGHGPVSEGDYIQPLEFWKYISSSQSYELMIMAKYGGLQYMAVYTTFEVASYAEKYRLKIGGYDPLSTLIDDLSPSDGTVFQAYDTEAPATGLCVSNYKMPFWNPNACGNVNPLGKQGDSNSKQGIYWDSLTGCCTSLTHIAFALRLSHCTEGSGLSCSACQPNFYLNKVGSISTCTPFCNEQACSECNPNNPLVCEGKCANGTYLDPSTKSCQKCHSLCKVCESASSSDCSECVEDAYFLDNSCHHVCPSQYYSLPTNECVVCPFSNCKACNSSECTECEDNFYSHLGSCIAKCPDSFYADDLTKTCVSCDPACTSCFGPSISECFSCDHSSYIFDEPSRCLPYCNAGLYYDETLFTCQNCHSSCTLCYGPTQDECEACITGRNLRESSCGVCQDSPGLFTDPTGTTECLEVCGDQYFYGINECDDGNLINGDGCNSMCQVEPYYDCSNLDSAGLSMCFHTLYPYIKTAMFDSSLKLTIYFSQPLTISDDLSSLDFNFTLTGPYSYVYSVYMATPLQNPTMQIQGQLEIETNLFGNGTELLQIKILSLDKFKDSSGYSLRTCYLTVELPPYQFYTDAELMAISTVMQTFSTSSYRGVIVDFSIFFSIVVFSGVLWSLGNTVQLMSFLPLVNVFVPYNFKQLFRILGFINMDIEIVQGSLQDYLFGSQYIKSEPFNQRYAQIRFESKLLTYNVSVLLALWGFMLSMLPIFVILRLLLPLPRMQAQANNQPEMHTQDHTKLQVQHLLDSVGSVLFGTLHERHPQSLLCTCE